MYIYSILHTRTYKHTSLYLGVSECLSESPKHRWVVILSLWLQEAWAASRNLPGIASHAFRPTLRPALNSQRFPEFPGLMFPKDMGFKLTNDS